jgi:hypothetical protein
MWLPTPTGKVAAEYPMDIHGGGNISPYLLNRQNPYAEVVKQWLPALKEYLAQKRADEIANQYLNMEQPPRAEAVAPSAYDPNLAMRQGLNSQTAPQATAPNTGGERAYKADVLYRSLLDKQGADQSQSTNDYWKNKVLEAQANKYQADADTPDPRLTSAESPVIDPQSGMVWNGRQWVKPSRQAEDWSMNRPLARGRLNEKGEFDNQYSEAASGDYVKLRTPKGDILVVPWSEYQKRAGRSNAGAELYRSKVQGQQPPQSDDQAKAITDARAAIAKGAKREDVKKRLEDAGYDSTGL